MLTIAAIPAFTDNYIWLLSRGGLAYVVDPGDAAPVSKTLREKNLRLAGILVTHHHGDHIGGIAELLRERPVPVYGPRAEAAQIPELTRLLDEGESLALPELQLEFRVLSVPGHTLGHIAYYAPGLLLCGDTLFSAGCGRLFEGTPAQMHGSLLRLAALPPETAVYCTHEYTLANLAFARAVEPDNPDVRDHTARVRQWRAADRPSLPSSVDLERRINPFLRCALPAVVQRAQQHAGTGLNDPVAVFAQLRRWKDGFRPPP